MRISTGTKYKDWSTSHTGKGLFINRLIPALKDLGAEVVPPAHEADIDLQLGKYVWEPKAKKSIIRMGCPHFNDPIPNKRKTMAVLFADAVVYQSEYARKACDKHLAKAKKSTVIHNGAPVTVAYPEKHKPVFIAATRVWNKKKHLKDIVRGFAKAKIGKLWIAGSVDKRIEARDVRYLGLLSPDQLNRYYRVSDVMIHLCEKDACPNSVVEALMCGCRVITNEDAGTKELLTENDVVIQSAKDLPRAIHEVKLSREYPEKLDIKNVAREYLAFFEEVLNG